MLEHLFPDLEHIVFDSVMDVGNAREDPATFVQTKQKRLDSEVGFFEQLWRGFLPNDTRGIRAFRESYPKLNIAPGLVICPCEQLQSLSPECSAVPWDLL